MAPDYSPKTPDQTPNGPQTPANRAQKKAARRAAFIQEVADAVLAAISGSVSERVHRMPLTQSAGVWLSELGKPVPVALGPFEQEYARFRRTADEAARLREAEWHKQYRAGKLLAWAISEGLLPEGATELPSEEVQRYLLTTYPAPTASE